MSKQVLIIGAVIVVLLVGGAYYVMKQNASAPAPAITTQPSSDQANPVMSEEPSASATSGATTTGAVKEFTVTGSNFKFDPATLTVNKGDTVKITFKNAGTAPHNITFTDFSAASKTITSGANDTVQFVADKAGTFQYYCSVGNHKAMGMVGTLTVK
jgi:cytochrome c oxidase subunit 2